jgi:hypothetical protein
MSIPILLLFAESADQWQNYNPRKIEAEVFERFSCPNLKRSEAVEGDPHFHDPEPSVASREMCEAAFG